MYSLQFNGIESTRKITDQQKIEFVSCTDQEKILALKALAQKIVPLCEPTRLYMPMEPAAGMSVGDYAQYCVIKHPRLFYFFSQFFPGLTTSPEKMLELYMKDTDDLVTLKEQLTSSFTLFLETKGRDWIKEFGLFVKNIEHTFACSEEKRRLAYKVLVTTCDSLGCLYGAFSESYLQFYREDDLQSYLFHCEDANELLAIEILEFLISKGVSHRHTGSQIAKYRIKDEKFLIKIAKDTAARCAWDLSYDISGFGIKDQDALVDIAKIAAAQSSWITSENIQKFGIVSEKGRVEVAKVALARFNERTLMGFSNYKIENTRDLLILFLMVLESNPSLDMSCCWRFQFGALCPDLYDAFSRLEYTSIDAKSICGKLTAFIDKQKWVGLKLVFEEQIAKIKKPPHQKAPLTWFAHFLGCCLIEEISAAHIDFLIRGKFIQSIFEYPDPSARYALTRAMLTLAKDDAAQSYMEEAFKTFTLNNKSKLKAAPRHSVLPLMLLSLIYAQGVSKEVCDAHFKQVCTSFKEGEATHSFKDGNYLKIYVRALSSILRTSELESVDKEYLLDKIFKEYLPCKEMKAFEIGDFLDQIEDSGELDPEEKEGLFDEVLRDYLFPAGFENPQLIPLIPCLRTIRAIDGMGKISKLKRSNLERSTFSSVLQESFQGIVPVKPIANFTELFLEHLDNARVPNYIIVYAATLAKAKEERALKFLAFCVESLLEGTFLEKRYDLESSLHLKAVFGDRPELFKEWKTGEVADLAPFLVSCDQAKQKIDFHEFLRFEILVDEHLKPEHLPHLRDFLNRTKTSSDALADIAKAIKPCPSESEEFSLLSLQAKCIELTDGKLSTLEQMGLLREIADLLKHIPDSKEFGGHIKALGKGLEEQSQIEETFDGYTIRDTDDFQDLAVCGTEVPGSCQSVDGDGDKNKCLMAFPMNGEIRLLEITNREGKIVARHIWKVLQPGEPVAFLERGYPFVVDSRLAQALVAFARMRAGKLGLKLLATQVGKGEAYGKPISSLGGLAPYEYTDAGGGVKEGGYTITRAHVL